MQTCQRAGIDLAGDSQRAPEALGRNIGGRFERLQQPLEALGPAECVAALEHFNDGRRSLCILQRLAQLDK